MGKGGDASATSQDFTSEWAFPPEQDGERSETAAACGPPAPAAMAAGGKSPKPAWRLNPSAGWVHAHNALRADMKALEGMAATLRAQVTCGPGCSSGWGVQQIGCRAPCMQRAAMSPHGMPSMPRPAPADNSSLTPPAALPSCPQLAGGRPITAAQSAAIAKFFDAFLAFLVSRRPQWKPSRCACAY